MTDREILELLLKKVTAIESDVSGVKSEVAEVKTELSSVKSEVAEVKTELSGVKSEVKELNRKMDVVCSQTAMLTEFRTEVNEKLNEMAAGQESISEILGRHEVQIMTLRKRPV